MSVNFTPAAFAAGEFPTAAKLNGVTHDPWDVIQDPLDPYACVWGASSTAPTLGNGTLVAEWFRVGKLVDFRILLTLGSTSALGSGYYTFTLPIAAAWPGSTPVGLGACRDASASVNLTRTALLTSSSAIALFDQDGGRVGASTPYVPAAGDFYAITGRYEAT